MLILSVHHLVHVALLARYAHGHVAAPSKITFLQAVVLGILQGVTELFPVFEPRPYGGFPRLVQLAQPGGI